MKKGLFLALMAMALGAVAPAFAVEAPDAAYKQSAEGVEYPLGDVAHRGTLAIGGNYEFYSAEGVEPAPPFDKEFSAGLYGAYSIVPKLSGVGSVAWGFDNQFLRSTLGLSYTMVTAPIALGIGVQYEWFYEGGDALAPMPGKEFTMGLRGGYPLNHWLVASGSAMYAVDSKHIRSALGLRALLYSPKF